MCLFAIVYQEFPEYPLLVLANREESGRRPSSSPEIMPAENPKGHWLGGRDLEAGGTWLGINRAGLVVAVTNRPKSDLSPHPTSRGLLCRAVLEQGSWDAAEAEFHRQWRTEQFAGFNLILLSRERGLVISAGDELRIEPVTPGRHAVTNGDWNDPTDPRITRIRSRLGDLDHTRPALETWITQAQTICGLGGENGQAALCIDCAAGWGTVSSSIIALADEPAKSSYLHAPGPPASTPYQEYSSDLRSLLEQPPMTSPHRIRLRGPWRYEWLSEEAQDIPPADRVMLPKSWRELFGLAAGSAVFRRTFHQPTNLDPGSRVDLVFEGLGGKGQISLNGQHLGEYTTGGELPLRFEITDKLRPDNELTVELQCDPEETSEPAGLWGLVVLEIHE